MCELKLEIITKVLRALGNRNHLNHDGVDCNKIGLGNLHMQIIMVHILQQDGILVGDSNLSLIFDYTLRASNYYYDKNLIFSRWY